MSDSTLIGMRRAAQRIGAKALELLGCAATEQSVVAAVSLALEQIGLEYAECNTPNNTLASLLKMVPLYSSAHPYSGGASQAPPAKDVITALLEMVPTYSHAPLPTAPTSTASTALTDGDTLTALLHLIPAFSQAT